MTNDKLQIANRPALAGLHLACCSLCFVISAASAAPVSFARDLAPILADKCLECHREKKAKGRYRLDTFEALLKPGESKDPPVTGGKPEASTLFTRLVSADDDERMPQKGDALPAAQIELFKRWIAAGASFDGPDPKTRLGDLIPRRDVARAPQKYPQPLPVTALALSEDGSRCFTSGYHELLQWSLADGKLLRRIPGMPERILAISLRNGGDAIAVAGGTPGRSGESLIVSRKTGAITKKLAGAKDTFLAARFSPDGSLLALGGTDNTVRVFRSSDWKQLWKAEAHADWVMALAFSPDGNQLASTSRDRTARVFDSQKGGILFTFVDHQSAVLSVVFDAEAETVITSAADGEVRRWTWREPEPESGERKDTKEAKDPKEKKRAKSVLLKSGRQEVTALAVSGDRLFTASSDGRVRGYDLRHTGDPLELGSLGARADVASVDTAGGKLVYAGQNGEVQVQALSGHDRPQLKFKASPGW
jgi:hypothetical protein